MLWAPSGWAAEGSKFSVGRANLPLTVTLLPQTFQEPLREHLRRVKEQHT
jgi:hypothetical protein